MKTYLAATCHFYHDRHGSKVALQGRAGPFLSNENRSSLPAEYIEVVTNGNGTKFERFDVMQMQQVKKRGTLIVN
jgi:hypothetical protein